MTSAVALVCLALAVLPEINQLAFDRQAILASEVWRLWTGHVVHFSFQHLFLDVSTLFLVGFMAERELGSRFVALVLLLGMPVLSLGLLLMAPELAHYRGASGVVMLLALVAGTAFWYRLPKLRIVLAILGLGLLAKTVLDAAGWGADISNLPSGVKVAWQAHGLGAVMGWAAARFELQRNPSFILAARCCDK